ncbi:MAG: hypothetical protein MJZ37_03220 [Bacilli bacterium]|nr:hypothetical protein [Bacilli bacterium]
MYSIKVFKVLTRNDTGETHSHQSGITIPKKVADTGIFPNLGVDVLNPRENVLFFDENKMGWEFQYIYYNDVFFGKPKEKAHNEHRLTCVRKYIQENNIKSGDSIWFSIDDNGIRHIGFIKQEKEEKNEPKKIVLGSGWHCVKI